MASFRGGMREVADHNRPWVRLEVETGGVRLGPWLFGTRRAIPTYAIPWASIDRVEQLPDRYRDGPALRFVLRAPVAAQEGPPNAARWPAAQQPVFLCGSRRRMRRVLSALPATVVRA